MPIERVSKSFKDLSMTFQISPLNQDLIVLKNESAIARSIRNIVFTLPGERFFDENFGSNVTRSIFENIDQISASILQTEIQSAIETYEPRVSLVRVTVNPNYDENSFDVIVNYQIIGSEVPSQQLQFVLQSVR